MSISLQTHEFISKWLVKSGAIADEQTEILERLYVHRKDIAHELAKYLIDVEHEPDADLFIEALEVLRDIRRFWTQIEIDIGSFADHGDITVDDVQPLSLLALGTFIEAYSDGVLQAHEQNKAQPQNGQQAETNAEC